MLEIILKAIGYLILTGGALFMALAIHVAVGEQKEELIRDHGRDGWIWCVSINSLIFLLIVVGFILLLSCE